MFWQCSGILMDTGSEWEFREPRLYSSRACYIHLRSNILENLSLQQRRLGSITLVDNQSTAERNGNLLRENLLHRHSWKETWSPSCVWKLNWLMSNPSNILCNIITLKIVNRLDESARDKRWFGEFLRTQMPNKNLSAICIQWWFPPKYTTIQISVDINSTDIVNE